MARVGRELTRTLLCAALALGLAAGANPPVLADAELCDARDDDGDGTVDEGCPRSCEDARARGGERLVSTSGLDADIGRDRSIAWDGAGYGTVWTEMDGYDSRVWFRLLDPSGNPSMDPVALAEPGPIYADPVIAWSGSVFGVAWSTEDFGLPEIFFATVDRAGNLLEGPLRVNTAEQDGQRPAIAWDGEAFVVAWTWYNARVHMRRVDEAGTLLGDEACITCDEASGAQRISLAIAPDLVGYLYSDGKGSVRYAESDLAGTPTGPALGLSLGTGSGLPTLAWGPGHFAASWYDRRGAGDDQIYVDRIAPGRTRLGPETLVSGGEPYATEPSIVWTGEEYLLSWVGGTADPFGIFLRRLGADGLPLDSARELPGSSRPFPRAQLVWGGASPALLRSEDESLLSRPLRLRLVDCCRDADGDGVGTCDGDLSDDDPETRPEAAELCDGVDNDLDGTLDEGCDGDCEAAGWVDASPGGTREEPAIALATRRGPTRALVVREAEDPGLDLELLRGGPPWSPSTYGEASAAEAQPASAWSGATHSTAWLGEVAGESALVFAAHDGDGSLVAGPLAAGGVGAGPELAWSGRTLVLAAGARLALLSLAGARLADGLILPEDTVETAAAPAPEGRVAVLSLAGAGEPRPWLELRDAHGGLVAGPVALAEAATAARDPAVVATHAGFLAAWSARTGGEREIWVVATDAALAPLAPAAALTSDGGSADAPSLAFTGEEIVALYRDARDGPTRPFRTRLDESGARLGPDVPLTRDRGIESPRIAWDGDELWTAWSVRDGAANGARIGRLACQAAPAAGLVRGLRFSDKETLHWDPVEAAVYDVVSGDLAALVASGGDFAVAIDHCEASGLTATQLELVERELPRLYLVRASVGGATGSWDADGPTAHPERDATIRELCP